MCSWQAGKIKIPKDHSIIVIDGLSRRYFRHYFLGKHMLRDMLLCTGG